MTRSMAANWAARHRHGAEPRCGTCAKRRNAPGGPICPTEGRVLWPAWPAMRAACSGRHHGQGREPAPVLIFSLIARCPLALDGGVSHRAQQTDRISVLWALCRRLVQSYPDTHVPGPRYTGEPTSPAARPDPTDPAPWRSAPLLGSDPIIDGHRCRCLDTCRKRT